MEIDICNENLCVFKDVLDCSVINDYSASKLTLHKEKAIQSSLKCVDGLHTTLPVTFPILQMITLHVIENEKVSKSPVPSTSAKRRPRSLSALFEIMIDVFYILNMFIIHCMLSSHNLVCD